MQLFGNPERKRGGVEFLLHRAAELYPDRVAIDDRLNGTTTTYSELRSRAAQLARALEQLGIGPGEPVAYVFQNETTPFEIIFACAMLGAVAMPLNNRLAPAEARGYLRRQQVETLIARPEFSTYAEDTLVHRLIVRGSNGTQPENATDYDALFHDVPSTPFPPRVSWDDPYAIMMTGGTTGGSKGATLCHGNAMFDMLSIVNHWEIKRGYKSLVCAPIFHAAGLGWACMPILWQAGTLIFPATTSFDPAAFLDVMRSEPVDSVFMVPAMVGPVRAAWDGEPINTLKSLTVASAPVPEPLRLQLAEVFPAAESLVCYGMTETYSIAMQSPDDFLKWPASCGEPALAARVRIVDDNGQEVSRGEIGNVATRTLGQCAYYSHDEENTLDTFRSIPGDPEALDWTHTGDLGFMDDGGRVHLVDRAKDVIISGGENVASVEVEAVVASHPSVRECAVVGQPDTVWGERVVAILVCGDEVTADPDSRLQLARETLAACRDQLAAYKAPKAIAFVEELPRSAFGKVLKRELREQTLSTLIEAVDLGTTRKADE